VGILQSRLLWATQSDALNDPDDHHRYLKVFCEQFVALFRPSDQKKMRDAFAEGIRMSRSRTFVTSFCGMPDEPSLWRAYGDNGRGFSLAFPLIPGTHRDDKVLGPMPRAVVYDSDVAMQCAITRLIDQVSGIAETHDQALHDQQLLGLLIRFATTESPRWKHPAFVDEREFRWILVQRDDALDKDSVSLRLHGRGEWPIRYVHAPFADDDLQGITVGPNRDFESTEKQLIEMLKFYGFDPAKVPITQSSIPWA